MIETILSLPFPPSVNAMYRNVVGKGRVKTRAYRAWLRDAGWGLRTQRPPELKGAVTLTIIFGAGKGRFDLSNHVKAVEDLLVSHRVIEDDNSQIINRLTCVRAPDVDGVLVRLKSITSKLEDAA